MITWGPWPGPQSSGGGGGGFFSTIYAAGVADAPAVDNLMTGTLQQFFVNLGATPPPFPPTNAAHFPESALFAGENPADSGVGADSKPIWRTRRWFSMFPSLGDHYNTETRYDLFGSGVNSITGGDRTLHVLVDQFENRLTFEIESSELTRPGLYAPGYNPIYLDGAPVSYQHWALMDALGGGNANTWSISSDGGMYRLVFLPNTIGPGGGPAGPWDFVANGMAMWSRNGGEPLVGSTLWYDAISVQTAAQFESSAGQTIVLQGAVLDVKNLGSGQAGGHAETWIRSTLGGPLVKVASYHDALIDFPVELITHNGAVFIGGATVDGTTSTTGDVNVGADLNIGSGDVHAGQAMTVGGPITGQGVGTVPITYLSDVVDFAAATTGTLKLLPFSIPGFYAETIQVRVLFDTGAGVCTTGPTYVAGNNAGEDNLISSTAITVAAVNACIAAGFPCQGGTGIAASGSAARQLVDLTTIPTIKITTPAAGTGGFALTGRILTSVTLIPV